MEQGHTSGELGGRKLSAVVSGSELGPIGTAACRTDEVKDEA